MTLERATRFRLYFDSSAQNAHEDVESIRSRLGAVADSYDVEFRETDVAEMPAERIAELDAEVSDLIDDDKPYYVDSRVLNENVFASVRPVLVIEYVDEHEDVYPHRDDDVSELPIGVEDFLDDVQDGFETDRGDFERIHADDESEETQRTSSSSDGDLIGELHGTLTSILPV